MPIRTNRGRAAVYRKLWGWPMRSPTHLVVLLVVVALLVIAISVAVPRLTGSSEGGGSGSGTTGKTTGQTTSDAAAPPAATGAQPPSAGQNTGGTSLPTRLPSPTQVPSSAPPEPAALDVAQQWGEAWVHHPEGITSEEWLKGLEPFTDEESMVELASVDPRNVPSTKVTGPPEATKSFTDSLTVTLPTDGVTLSITLISTPDGWRVTSYEEVT